jgi:hypothetical protein
VISRGRSWTAVTKASAAVAASLVAISLAACGGSTSGSTGGSAEGSATKTVTAGQTGASADASATQTVTASQSSPAHAADKKAAVPDYQPASVVSKSTHSTVLASPDSISKIGTFYRAVLAKGGWQLRSSSSSAYHASFSAHRAGEGVNVSVYPRGSGSGISISGHPE